MFRWYIVNTYSGQENRVKNDLLRRAETLGAAHLIRQIVIPTETVYEGNGAKRKQVEKRTMPGYILIESDINETSWAVIRHTPGVTGFVSNTGEPEPLSKLEANRILGIKNKKARTTPKIAFNEGDQVMISAGPLKDFSGTVSQVEAETDTVTVNVSIFGRETPTKVPSKDVKKV